MYNKNNFKKNISKYYLVRSLEITEECKGPQQPKYLGCFPVSLKVSTTRYFLDYSSSLLSAHLSNLSGLKMLKHMLTVKHMSIITDPNETT